MIGTEEAYVLEAIRNRKISGDGPFSAKCHDWFQRQLGCAKALMTPSCTQALEMMAILLDIGPGDEVIMPSFTFPSTANAFALRGAKIVFVDVREDTMNIDEGAIEGAISENTKAIMVVHYAGVGCEMDAILEIGERHGIPIVEDAAQGMMASYCGKPLGTLGTFGAFSFHETKNYSCGEGGLLIINDAAYAERAEIIREKGTDRSRFFRGMVDKYSWVDIGSSYLCSDINAAYLFAQLEQAEVINQDRLASWRFYYESLSPLATAGHISLPRVPDSCTHNAHMFYLKVNRAEERDELIAHLGECGVKAVFHYIPLHASREGEKVGTFSGVDKNTTSQSERLIRLPMYYGLSREDASHVVRSVAKFFDA